MRKLIHGSTSFCQETMQNLLSLFPLHDSEILRTGMANQLRLSNSADIFFVKSSDSGFNYCSVNLLLEEIEHDEQLPVLQIISREQGSLDKMIAALYVITGNNSSITLQKCWEEELLQSVF